MSPIPMRSLVRGFKPYTAGLSIDEIREKYGIERVIKLASNENPLGTSPLVSIRWKRMSDWHSAIRRPETPAL